MTITDPEVTTATPEQLIKNLTTVTADQIAAHLDYLGIKGDPECAEPCAIAEYILQLSGAEYVSVCTRTAHIRMTGERYPTKYHLPLNVQAFIALFDAGEYPDLKLERVRPVIKPL